MRGAIFWSFIIISYCYSIQDQPIMLDFDVLYLPTHFTYFDQACKQLWSDLDLLTENPELLQAHKQLETDLDKKLELMVSHLEAMATSDEASIYLKDDVEYAVRCVDEVFEKYSQIATYRARDIVNGWYENAFNLCKRLYVRSYEV